MTGLLFLLLPPLGPEESCWVPAREAPARLGPGPGPSSGGLTFPGLSCWLLSPDALFLTSTAGRAWRSSWTSWAARNQTPGFRDEPSVLFKALTEAWD